LYLAESHLRTCESDCCLIMTEVVHVTECR